MGSYTPRKGSLGFSFKRIKNRVIQGGNKAALWFHKVGITHNQNQQAFEPNTFLQMLPTEIKGYYCIQQPFKLLSAEQIVLSKIPTEKLRTILSIKSKFRK